MTDFLLGGEPGQTLPIGTDSAAPGSAAPARSLVQVFAATAEQFAEYPAIDAGDEVLTYAELSEAAHAVARRLCDRGVGPGDRVGVYVPSGSTELHVAILGVLIAEAAYVPIDAEDPPARASAAWRASGACAVVESGLSIADLAPASGLSAPLAVDDDAWVIFTSGSSGEPKGVAVSHRAAAAFVDAEAGLWDITPEDRVLAGLSVGFDASCEEMWLAWRNGAALVPAPRALMRSPAELGQWLGDRDVTVVSTVPTLAAMLDAADLASVRLMILGGEACPDALAWRLAAEFEVWNTYGPTEATVVSTAARLEPGKLVTMGWPLRGWKIAIVDHLGQPVPLGEPGQLAIGGVGLGRYLDSELDGQRYVELRAAGLPRAFMTGDIVRETVDGLRFLGRQDDQVKLAGRRLELGEIDAQLSAVPGVKAACAAIKESSRGNRVLVGYIVGDADPAHVRSALAERLPAGIVPLIVKLESFPPTTSGKVNRNALPWPPPGARTNGAGLRLGAQTELTSAEAWLAQRWVEQLGPLPLTRDSDFFELGGSSLAAAKLVSAVRGRFPAFAVADVYKYRRLGELSNHLDEMGAIEEIELPEEDPRRMRWSVLQVLGVFALRALAAPPWLLAALALNRVYGTHLGPQLGWGWLIAGWLLFASIPGRAMLLVTARKLLLKGLRSGRFPRHGWMTFRIWFVERLTAAWRLENLAGTPWAARYARLCGHRVGRGARLFTLPPVTSLISIGDDATLESNVDIEGWWIEGGELVVGELRVENGARIGTHSVLMPGTVIGVEAEVEPGSVVAGIVPARQRWGGSPAKHCGPAGQSWPASRAPSPTRPRLWKTMYGLGIALKNLLPLAAAVPGLVLLAVVAPDHGRVHDVVIEAITVAPLIVVCFLIAYGLLIAMVVRALSPLVKPGWHPEDGPTRWALWLTDLLMAGANDVLFPVYLSVYTRFWLRLVGIPVGKLAEVSVAEGLNRLTKLADTTFVADAVVFATTRSRCGWLHVGPIEVGSGSFLGNGAIVEGSTKIGKRSLIGVLTKAPRECPNGTSWFGCPPVELPRRADCPDATRTTNPTRRLVLARGATELVRIVLPGTISVILGCLVFWALEQIGARAGLLAMAVATPLVFMSAGACAVALTVALKWLLMGRYKPGEHPLWSFFVWRDEIMNTCQEQLAAAWLMGSAQATPLMSVYLRMMGAKVGRDVWCETMTITEFDMVELGDGCVVNRHGIVETHLFHDRLLRIGPTKLGPQSTLGPISAVLPDAGLGAGCCVGARSVVMRGEQLPARTHWHGAPVVSCGS